MLHPLSSGTQQAEETGRPYEASKRTLLRKGKLVDIKYPNEVEKLTKNWKTWRITKRAYVTFNGTGKIIKITADGMFSGRVMTLSLSLFFVQAFF